MTDFFRAFIKTKEINLLKKVITDLTELADQIPHGKYDIIESVKDLQILLTVMLPGMYLPVTNKTLMEKEILVVFDFTKGKALILIDGQYIERNLIILFHDGCTNWIGAKYMKHADKIVRLLQKHGNVEAKTISLKT